MTDFVMWFIGATLVTSVIVVSILPYVLFIIFLIKPRRNPELSGPYDIVIENKTISAKKLSRLIYGKRALVRGCTITGIDKSWL